MNIQIGYIPGQMPWLVGENLRKQGITILSTGISGQTHADRKLLTGHSPLASNNLGLLAAETLVKAVSDGQTGIKRTMVLLLDAWLSLISKTSSPV